MLNRLNKCYSANLIYESRYSSIFKSMMTVITAEDKYHKVYGMEMSTFSASTNMSGSRTKR